AFAEPDLDTVEGGELWCPSCGEVFTPDLETCPDDGTPLAPWRDPVVGSVLDGRFRVERPLAEGATGIVYQAMQLAVERPVAIKVIRAHCVHDPSIAKRFLREVRVLTAFRHPNVVDVYDYGQLPDGRPYMVMELVRGETLDHLLARSHRMGIV